jgi:hypothetical protein
MGDDELMKVNASLVSPMTPTRLLRQREAIARRLRAQDLIGSSRIESIASAETAD